MFKRKQRIMQPYVPASHIQQDDMQTRLFGLESRLKLLRTLQKQFGDDPSPQIEFQLKDARDVVRRDLQALNSQGVSVSDILARFGDQLMQAKIVEAQYLLRRFGKPHNDFVNLFRDQAAYEQGLQREKQATRNNYVRESSNVDDLRLRLEQLVEVNKADQMPVVNINDEIVPQVAYDLNQQDRPAKVIAAEIREELKSQLEEPAIQEGHGVTEASRVEASDIKPAEIQAETTAELKNREENNPARMEPSLISKIETEEDLEKFAREQGYLNKRGAIRNQTLYKQLLRVLRSQKLPFSRRVELQTYLGSMLKSRVQKPEVVKTESAQLLE